MISSILKNAHSDDIIAFHVFDFGIIHYLNKDKPWSPIKEWSNKKV